MSIESILLAVFLLFPLLERLSRHLRERAAQGPDDPAAATPPQRPVRTRRPGPGADESAAPGQTDLPSTVPAVLIPPPLPPRHPAAERLSASDRVRAARLLQTDVVAPPSTPRTRPRARMGMTRLGGRADWRRAVVLTAVLGPCKALENEPGRR